MLSNNNVMALNDIVYKIHSVEDFDQMRRTVLTSLKLIIPSEILTFYLASQEIRGTLADPIGIGMPDEEWQHYLDEYWDLDYTRWVFDVPTAKAYRETDFISDEERIQTPYYQRMYAPNHFHYSAIITIIKDGIFYGCICLYRKIDQADFSDEEMLMMELLIPHLNHRCAKEADLRQIDPSPLQSGVSLPDKDFLEDHYHLTRREIEITCILLAGSDREAICEELSISPNTLKKHIINIYKKLDVSSQRELYFLFR